MTVSKNRLFRVIVGEHGLYEAATEACPESDDRYGSKPDESWLPQFGEQFATSITFWTEFGLWRYINSGLFDWHKSLVSESISILIAETRPDSPEYENEFQVVADEFVFEVDEFLMAEEFAQDDRFRHLFTTKAPVLETERLRLDHVCLVPWQRMVTYYRKNAEHFAPTDPTGVADEKPEDYTKARMVNSFSGLVEGRTIRFVLFEKSDAGQERAIGTVGLNEIVRGPFQSSLLGYAIDKDFEGKGLMTEALQAVIEYAFQVQNLHRLEANHLPENARSAKVLEKLGFTRIGTAPNYLNIAGGWKDHCLNQLINPNWPTR